MSGRPTSWAVATLGDITATRISQRGPVGVGTFTYIDISSIDNERKEILNPKVLPIREAPSRAKQEIQQNDVLVSMTRPNLNAVARVPVELNGAIASTGFHVLRTSAIDPRWISWRVKSKVFVQEMTDLVQGALYPAIRPSDVQAHCLPIPPLLEQNRILAKIESLMARSQKAREALADIPGFIDRFRQAILASACEGRLTENWRDTHPAPMSDSHVEAPGEPFPESWMLIPFGDLIEYGPQNGLYKHQSAYGNGSPIVRIDAFYEGTIQDWNSLKRLEVSQEELETFGLKNDDILINRVNSPKYLGKSALVVGIPEPCVFESNMMRLRLDTSRITPSFARLYLQSPRGLDELRKNAKHAVNQSSINQQDVKAALVLLPPLNEQAELVRRVTQALILVDQIMARCLESVAEVESFNQSILAKAFRGELVPQDPTDEPAEALLTRIRAELVASPTPTRRGRGVPPIAGPQPQSLAPLPTVVRKSAPASRSPATRPKADDLDANTVLRAFRQALAAQVRWDSDDNLLRVVAQRLGYERLGSSVKETLRGYLRDALLRRIVERQDDGTLGMGPRTLDAYTRDELIGVIPSVLRKGQAVDRDELMKAILHHLAFQRLTDPAHEALRSALNGAVRRGVLQAEGQGVVRRQA